MSLPFVHFLSPTSVMIENEGFLKEGGLLLLLLLLLFFFFFSDR